MKIILSNSNDPYLNLAWEEYILKNIHNNEDVFLLWQNDLSIVVGRNQNVYEEVNLPFIVKNKIPLVRRISGGGTVFHDLGNINYSYITSSKGNINNYELMTSQIIKALNQMGINAYFSPKSDIKLDNKKISGNAQLVYGNKLLHHGTLLFNSNLDSLSLSIKNKDDLINSISVKSNRSQVTNIKDYCSYDISEFKNKLISLLPIESELTLSTKDLNKIIDLKNEKYISYQWNYGESPRSIIEKENEIYKIKFSIVYGTIEDSLIIKDGAFALSLSASLTGLRLHPSDLSFLKANNEDLFNLIFS